MIDLNNLSPAALKAAMQSGTDSWGWVGRLDIHVRYMEPSPPTFRRRCPCGCRKRAAFMGKANGVALASGCELTIARWVRTGDL